MGEEPSSPELLRRIREKASDLVFWPVVTDKIILMKQVRRGGRDDGEKRSIYHIDIQNAAATAGAVHDRKLLEDGWDLTIEGFDAEGYSLTVMVHLSCHASDPLLVMNFTIPQP